MRNGAAISWRSKQQATLSLSSAESKFIADSQCGQEVVYLREILKEFGAEHDNCTRVFEDNPLLLSLISHSRGDRYGDVTSSFYI